MKVNDFVLLAKKAQGTLRSIGMPAEHIYLVGYSDPRSIPSLVFVSSEYDKMDLYRRAELATLIQQGPLKFNFYVLGTDHILNSKNTLGRDTIYRAVKLYGKQPLILNGFEYASKSDMELLGNSTNELPI